MNSRFLLRDGTIVNSEGSFRADLRITGSRIQEIGPNLKSKNSETEIDCSGYFIYPGLINSHDHLEFNLLPRLGDPPYHNAYEWGNDLHRRWKSSIESILKIPLKYRLWWGAWKNLLSGVTTVIHHNKYYYRFRIQYPLTVLRRYTFAHSLQFEPSIDGALKRRKKGTSFIIHLAEGTDKIALAEVELLQRLTGLDERTVAVHCIGLKESDIDAMRRAQASMVWCPSSNIYLFGETARIHDLLQSIPVALGTDSTLTGSITLFDELRLAKRESRLAAQQLFRLITDVPRQIFRLPSDAGKIIEGGEANLFLLRSNGENPYDSLENATPADLALLMRKGQIKLSEPHFMNHHGYPINIRGKRKVIRDPHFASYYETIKPFLSHYTYFDSNPKQISLPSRLEESRFFCPSCHKPLQKTNAGWTCTRESYTFRLFEDMPDFILPHRRSDVERFLKIYQTVRSNEQWGSPNLDYYLALPYRDRTKRHSRIWKIRTRTYDCFVKHLRDDSTAPPRILDLGAGNCWLSKKLAEKGYHVVAVDIHTDSLDGLGVAKRLREQNSVSFQCVRAEFDFLPFHENYFDVIVFNASLHYAKDPYLTLLNTGRVLKEGGSMYVLDSPIYRDERSGRAMVDERRNDLRRRFDIEISEDFSGSFLLYDQMRQLEDKFSVQFISPRYGLRWNARRMLPFLLKRREPASFEIVRLQTRSNSRQPIL